jgi:hypothetical protein
MLQHQCGFAHDAFSCVVLYGCVRFMSVEKSFAFITTSLKTVCVGQRSV